MGLLNDAIREHLELKRQHGADPGEVDRLELEALGPIHQSEGANEDQEYGSLTDFNAGAEHAEGLVEEQQLASTRQETAELDMSSVLGEAEATPSEEVPRVSGRLDDQAAKDHPGADSLEWEVPADHLKESDAEGAGEEDIEDVLEETPDFLQETPEHERLWFEQRPPRDFDFDE